MRMYLTLLLILTMSVAVISCDSRRPSAPAAFDSDGISNEAKLAALWLSAELRPPLDLAIEVEAELALIRSTFGSSVPHTEIEFNPGWYPGIIEIGFTPSAFDSLRDGTYHYWDDLNDELGIVLIDTVFCIGECYVQLRSDQLLSPRRMVEPYAGLPGVVNISYFHIHDTSVLLLFEDWRGRHYFFRRGWGDCPSGCVWSGIAYFLVKDGEASYMGYWTGSVIEEVPWVEYESAWGRFWSYYPWNAE